jgi:hypothetical protein
MGGPRTADQGLTTKVPFMPIDSWKRQTNGSADQREHDEPQQQSSACPKQMHLVTSS